MDPVQWIRNHLVAAVVVALVSTAIAATSAAGIFGWLAVMLVTAGTGSGAATLGSLLPAFVLGVLVGGPLAVVAAVGVGYVLVTRAALALRVETARHLFRLAERYPLADALLGFSEYAAAYDPRTPLERAEDRIAPHKRRYVAGDISEPEFERRVRRILDDEGVYREMATPDDLVVSTDRTVSVTTPGSDRRTDAERRSLDPAFE